MSVCSKRYRRFLVPLNDQEYDLLNSLVMSHTLDGNKPSKSAIVRYGLRLLAASLNPVEVQS